MIGEHVRFRPGHHLRVQRFQPPAGPWFRPSQGRWYISGRKKGSMEAWARLVLRNKLGRDLRPGEQAHHINGDMTDDRPANLEAVKIAEHTYIHNAERRRERATLNAPNLV